MSYEQIRIEQDGRIASLVLARPTVRNAMTSQMGDEIARAVGELDEMEDLRAVLIRGEGQSFAAGGDFSFIEARSTDLPERNRHLMTRFYRQFLTIRRLRVPTIAVLHGAAIGAGCCFAMACDIRLAASGTKLGLNFVRIGLHPGMGATYFLPRLVGTSMATELLLTGRIIDADEALRIGLVNHVYAGDELLSAAREMAEEIAESAPLAVVRTKGSLQESLHLGSLDDALGREAYAQALDYATEDVAEGVRAFYDKRAPVFRGR